MMLDKNYPILIEKQWGSSTLSSECSFHQLSPYLGKIKSSIAKSLIENYSNKGDFICDPFCGAATIPLEGWLLHRNIIANDLNYYAYVLASGKMNPPKSLGDAIDEFKAFRNSIEGGKLKADLRKVPKWVRRFFHPETLRETIAWSSLLRENKSWFLLSCLLGILHHQRPGFLSFPSSHTVPYLREKKFPKSKFPEFYQYRNVADRLEKKLVRAFKRVPKLNMNIKRYVYNQDATQFESKQKIDLIITSPPYMRQLDYARDNRLRLWFLGVKDWHSLDQEISPREADFIVLMRKCFYQWSKVLKKNGKCVLIIGDNHSHYYGVSLPEMLKEIATNEIGNFQSILELENIIPDKRRVRKNYRGILKETILVLKKIN